MPYIDEDSDNEDMDDKDDELAAEMSQTFQDIFTDDHHSPQPGPSSRVTSSTTLTSENPTINLPSNNLSIQSHPKNFVSAPSTLIPPTEITPVLASAISHSTSSNQVTASRKKEKSIASSIWENQLESVANSSCQVSRQCFFQSNLLESQPTSNQRKDCVEISSTSQNSPAKMLPRLGEIFHSPPFASGNIFWDQKKVLHEPSCPSMNLQLQPSMVQVPTFQNIHPHQLNKLPQRIQYQGDYRSSNVHLGRVPLNSHQNQGTVLSTFPKGVYYSQPCGNINYSLYQSMHNADQHAKPIHSPHFPTYLKNTDNFQTFEAENTLQQLQQLQQAHQAQHVCQIHQLSQSPSKIFPSESPSSQIFSQIFSQSLQLQMSDEAQNCNYIAQSASHQVPPTMTESVSNQRQQQLESTPQCGCAIDDCCDICCDFGSQSIDVETSMGQDSRIPQIDGSFDQLVKKKPRRGKLRFNPLPVRVTKLTRNKTDSREETSESSNTNTINRKEKQSVRGSLREDDRELVKTDLDKKKKKSFTVLNQMVQDLKNAKPNPSLDYASSDSQSSTSSRVLLPSSSSSTSSSSSSSSFSQVGERVLKRINGFDLLIPKSIDDNLLRKIGHEIVPIEGIDQGLMKIIPQRIKRRLSLQSHSSQKSTSSVNITLSHLKGQEKIKYLLSLCRPLQVVIDQASIISESDLFHESKSQEIAIKRDTAEVSETFCFKTKSSKQSLRKRADVKIPDPGRIPLKLSKPEIPVKEAHQKDIKNKEADDERWKSSQENHLLQLGNNASGSSDTEVSDIFEIETPDLSVCSTQSSDFKLGEALVKGASLKNMEKICKKPPTVEIPCHTSFSSGNALSFCNTSGTSHSNSRGSLSLSPQSSQSLNLLSQSFAPSNKKNKHSTPQISRKRGRPHKNPTIKLNSPGLHPIPEKEEALSSRETQTTAGSQKLKTHQRSKTGSLNESTESKPQNPNKRQSLDSIVEGVTGENTFNFKFGSYSTDSKEKQGQTKYSVHEYQFITCMALEVIADTEKDKSPDPSVNSIRAVFYGIMNDVPPDSTIKQMVLGVIVLETDVEELAGCNDSILTPLRRRLLARSGFNCHSIKVSYAKDEFGLLSSLVEVVKQYDPDIMLGYEIERNSWAYVLQRADFLNMSVKHAISRVLEDKYAKCTSEYDLEFRVGIEISGRIVLNLWRIIRREIKLTTYSYENVHYHILHQRIPAHSLAQLCEWFECDSNRWRVLDYFLTRVEGCLKIVDKMNLISLTSELSRLFGIQFYEVFSRGSQFRVESMMFRSAKPLDYIIFSPSALQRQRMRYIECLPLIMEPEANFYSDPVVVLDFQSLYPSIMIAYNYCYSTCLGWVENIIKEEQFEFGCSSLYVPTHILKQYANDIYVSPCGVAFIKPHIRRGVVPQMLEEILTSRIMVKNSIKVNNKRPEPSKSLHKLLNARQLGLKLISNVTYGYTSANYSGRMPSVEIADSIVSKGREILERAIEMIHNTPSWGGKVVYGDTDSLFIHFPGVSKAEAFSRGQEICVAVTDDNPYPIKLKFEKVYQPCVLQTKKRYVGYMWETLEQKEGILEAKGNEAIRRDTCPAAAKILEKAVKILFKTQDVENHVKPYVQRQLHKILRGRISNLQDFIFAREYRGSERYTPNACVPSLKIARKIKETNPRGEPLRRERVPYLIVFGTPEQPLIQLVKQPLELINNPSLRLNGTYYIERIIVPTLNRVFSMMGCDVMQWYAEIPRMKTYQRSIFLHAQGSSSRPTTLLEYFAPGQCPVCGQKAANDNICSSCLANPVYSAVSLKEEIRSIEKRFHAIVSICKSCTGSNDIEQNCISVECPQLYRYSQSKLDIHNVDYLNKLLEKLEVTSSVRHC